MFKLLAILLLLQSPPSKSAVTAQSILNDYLKAKNPGLTKITSVEMKGVVSIGHFPGPHGWDLHFWESTPEKAMLQFEQSAYGDILYGRNGHRLKAKGRGAAFAINGITVEAMEKNLEAVIEYDFSKYKAIELLGRKLIGKREAFAIRFVPFEGDPDIRYFDRSSHLMVRIERAQRIVQPDKRESAYVISADLSDYADFNGIQMPKKTSYSSAEADVYVHITSMVMNNDLPAAIFE